ncbi:MAG: vWA domain-containing protein [Mesonia hippocampi]|uniref:vWA domain-containing protein n=1 Tax=Mesonia hippocampi TaxID=1628250 RepID=UPI003F9EAE0B
MQFLYPKVLYALFLLLIPVLIHLFQLRKFKKEIFSNVAFLKKVNTQSRKSRQLKKWLILGTRLAALACIIIAFAQPYFPLVTELTSKKEKELVIYLDNSFSMQLQGKSSSLLEESIQELLQSFPEDYPLSIITNSNTYKNTNLKKIKEELLQTSFSSKKTAINNAFLKATTLFSKNSNTEKHFVAVSDFQENITKNIPVTDSLYQVHYIVKKPENTHNIAIDTIYFKEGNHQLNIKLSSNQLDKQLYHLSLYDGDTPFAKNSFSFATKKEQLLSISLPENGVENGKISLEDNGLTYDNSIYFNTPKKQSIKIAIISNEDPVFLKRIYANLEEFSVKTYTEKNVNYKELSEANFIILNNLNKIPPSLAQLLVNHKDKKGALCIIPSNNIKKDSYNLLLSDLQHSPYALQELNDVKVTQLNFSHPIFQDVFSKPIENFDYPTVKHSYTFKNPSEKILSYQNHQAFLSSTTNKVYVFSSALTPENSNFTQSPLIVPVFYNMAKTSTIQPQLYYLINKQNNILITPPENSNPENVLSLALNTATFIPLQQKHNDKIVLTTQDLPQEAGIYKVKLDQQDIAKLSFNYDRTESNLTYTTLKNTELNTSINTFANALVNADKINNIWKWFIIFALIFLLAEVALLKLLK